MTTYTLEDAVVEVGGKRIEAVEPEPTSPADIEATVNGKPLSPLSYINNSGKMEFLTFDDGETFVCSYESWQMLMKKAGL